MRSEHKNDAYGLRFLNAFPVRFVGSLRVTSEHVAVVGRGDAMFRYLAVNPEYGDKPSRIETLVRSENDCIFSSGLSL